MKALTLKHPWAFAIANLGKRIENRTWKPPASIVGQFIAIHGGAAPYNRARMRETLRDARLITQHIPGAAELTFQALGSDARLRDMITPGVVCVAKVTGYVERSHNPWFTGPYGWTLEDVFTLSTPMQCKGAQGLWELPSPIIEAIRSEWAAAKAVAR